MKHQASMFFAITVATFLVACGAEIASSDNAVQSDPSSSQAPVAMANSDDPITALCISYGDQVEICECATDSFRGSEPEAEIYAEIASLFLDDTEPGKNRADRWEDAQQAVLVEHQRTADKHVLNNRFGRGHRSAIDSCRD